MCPWRKNYKYQVWGEGIKNHTFYCSLPFKLSRFPQYYSLRRIICHLLSCLSWEEQCLVIISCVLLIQQPPLYLTLPYNNPLTLPYLTTIQQTLPYNNRPLLLARHSVITNIHLHSSAAMSLSF